MERALKTNPKPVLTSHISETEIYDFILRNLLSKKEKIVHVFSTASSHEYQIVLKKKSLLSYLKLDLKDDKLEYFKAYDDHFEFRDTNKDGGKNLLWIRFLLSRCINSTAESIVTIDKAKITQFLKDNNIIFIQNSWIYELTENEPYEKTFGVTWSEGDKTTETNLIEAEAILAQGSDIYISGNAYGGANSFNGDAIISGKIISINALKHEIIDEDGERYILR